jgi:Na+-driven multidrug efflux pump
MTVWEKIALSVIGVFVVIFVIAAMRVIGLALAIILSVTIGAVVITMIRRRRRAPTRSHAQSRHRE